MNSISNEQIEIYKNILNLGNVTHIEIIMMNYRGALLDCLENDNCNVEKLKLIIDSFCFYTGFEITEPNYNKLIEIDGEIRKKIKQSEPQYTHSEATFATTMLISNELLKYQEKFKQNEMVAITRLLNNLLSLVESIEKYENQKNEVQKTKSIR